MKIYVKARAGAKVAKVERVSESNLNLFNKDTDTPVYKVWVREKAVGGEANEAIRRALAEHFEVAPSLVTLVSGQIAKQKIFEIEC